MIDSLRIIMNFRFHFLFAKLVP